jgi:transposase-like protein
MTTRHTASSARAEGKSPGPPARPRRACNDEERRAALDRVTVVGLAAAHRETGIPRRTLSDWTRAAGVDLGEHARARTARATATAPRGRACRRPGQ